MLVGCLVVNDATNDHSARVPHACRRGQDSRVLTMRQLVYYLTIRQSVPALTSPAFGPPERQTPAATAAAQTGQLVTGKMVPGSVARRMWPGGTCWRSGAGTLAPIASGRLVWRKRGYHDGTVWCPADGAAGAVRPVGMQAAGCAGAGVMAGRSGEQGQKLGRGRFSWRLIEALYSPDSYALVLLLILVTYALSTTLTASWAASLIVAVQIATVWVTLRAARARRSVQAIANLALVVAALAAAANLFFRDQFHGSSIVLWVSCLLYLAAPVSIVRHLLRRPTVDAETVLGAIAAYLMAGMFFAFLYRAVGAAQTRPPFFGPQGPGTFSQDLFFSFTTLTTTGYGNLVPSANPGQSFAVLEMLIGQLFLVTAVAKVVSAWRPGRGRGGLRGNPDDH